MRQLDNNGIAHTPNDEGNSPPQSDWAAFWPSERPFARVTITEGGESSMHFRVRVASFIEEMLEQRRGKTIIAVCHGGGVDALLHLCVRGGTRRRRGGD